jgi:hypothetical protein
MTDDARFQQPGAMHRAEQHLDRSPAVKKMVPHAFPFPAVTFPSYDVPKMSAKNQPVTLSLVT